MKYSINLGLPDKPLVKDKDLFTEVLYIYNAIRNLLAGFDIVTGALQPDKSDWVQLKGTGRVSVGGMFKIYLEANVPLTYGQTVGIVNVAGVGKAALAQSGVLLARGWCSDTQNTAAGDTTEITLLGSYPSFAAGTLTPGANYYQSVVARVIGAAGAQAIGYAVSDTQLIWHPDL